MQEIALLPKIEMYKQTLFTGLRSFVIVLTCYIGFASPASKSGNQRAPSFARVGSMVKCRGWAVEAGSCDSDCVNLGERSDGMESQALEGDRTPSKNRDVQADPFHIWEPEGTLVRKSRLDG
jgi:hypothetical protein